MTANHQQFQKELDNLLNDSIELADTYGPELVRQVKISHAIKRTAESVRRANLQCVDELLSEVTALTTGKITDARAAQIANDIAQELGWDQN